MNSLQICLLLLAGVLTVVELSPSTPTEPVWVKFGLLVIILALLFAADRVAA